MNELLVEVARELDNLGFGVYGTSTPSLRTIYTEDMPDDCVEGILVTNRESPSPNEDVATEYTILEFEAKSPKAGRAREMMREIFNTYHRRYGYSYQDWYVYFSRAVGSMVGDNRDAEGSKLYRLSIQFRCRNLNTVS